MRRCGAEGGGKNAQSHVEGRSATQQCNPYDEQQVLES
jgi:hypothetical protein